MDGCSGLVVCPLSLFQAEIVQCGMRPLIKTTLITSAEMLMPLARNQWSCVKISGEVCLTEDVLNSSLDDVLVSRYVNFFELNCIDFR